MKKYILGLFTGIIALPILESLLELTISWIEVAKTKPNEKIMEWNHKMGADVPETDTYAIGFQVPSEEEEYYDDED